MDTHDLAHDLAAAATRVPSSLRIKGNIEKHVLRDAGICAPEKVTACIDA